MTFRDQRDTVRLNQAESTINGHSGKTKTFVDELRITKRLLGCRLRLVKRDVGRLKIASTYSATLKFGKRWITFC